MYIYGFQNMAESTNNGSENPLSKYFRQPKLYIKLPSKGKWYPDGALEPTATGELPVYAMTGKDELILKTPDSLLNGQSTVDVIESCIPNIKNAWTMPTVDIDAVLIAIRQATYGNRMEFVSVCPHCGEKNESAIDLGGLFSRIVCPDYEKTIRVGPLEIYLKPQDYKSLNQISFETFEQQRVLNVLADDTLSEQDKAAKFNKLFAHLLDITVGQVASCVAGIKAENGVMVQNEAQIHEFLKNCEKPIWDSIKNKLEQMSEDNITRNIPLVCENELCKKEYTTPLIFEQTNFFG